MRKSLYCQSEQGQALLVALGLIVVLSMFGAAALQFTGSNNSMAARQRDFAKVEAAADAAQEHYYAQWKKAIFANDFNALTKSQLDTFVKPQPSLHPDFQAESITFPVEKIEVCDPWGAPIGLGNPNGFTSEDSIPAGGFPEYNLKNYPGWVGYSRCYRTTVSSRMPAGPGVRGSGNEVATAVRRYFQMANVPLFQFVIFFEEDLELHPGEDMTLAGKVHTNQDAWCIGYEKLQFLNQVSYVGSYNETVSPERAKNGMAPPTELPWWSDNKQSDTSKQKPAQLTAVDRMEPFGTAPKALFDKTDSNPNNDSLHELIEPPSAGGTDPAPIAKKRIYNKAGVVVKIDSTKASNDPNRVVVSGPGLSSSNKSNIEASVGSTVSLYDRREQKYVPTTSVDVYKLSGALDSVSDFNGVVYLDDVASGTRAVRLQNGAELQQDLTIASGEPVYIQGDFNTGGGHKEGSKTHNPNLVPSNNNGNPAGTDNTVANGYEKKTAAVIGDAVMILSNNWNDANAAKSISSRNATHTTINAAIMAGYLPTDYNNNNAPGGGAHNLPRFLENWNGRDFTYLGSMVQVYVSEKYQGLWNTGQIYSPPDRRWAFDNDLMAKQPPGSIDATVYSRGRWERVAVSDPSL
jgi:type II secretory pathway pseudopilin PulG